MDNDADKETIMALQEGAKWLREVLLDFIIVGDNTYWSMFEEMDRGDYTLGSVN